ncbi:hypothetical protein D9756_004346 [Leucocoprinus leucothites]|uniref:Mediator of RNA polymerase II transcription subunit 9 n=1 Tax=Leucocoprinus leucothites TaxID=201217 RepID=A0A8H5DBX3_9AGAR|nr:hypothetical protein D9756_004346 [Leucoagaricus leucothites]
MDPRNTNKQNSQSPIANDHVMGNTQEQTSLNASATGSTMPSNPLPVNLYESLLLKLVTVLQLTHQTEGTTTPAAKQTILQATNDFKSALAQAKDLVANLPGGELMIQEQDEVIQMLETLRDRKRAQLEQFSRQPLQSSTTSATENQMEIDSVASTPAND